MKIKVEHITPLTYIFWILLDQKGMETEYFNGTSKQWLSVLSDNRDDKEFRMNRTNRTHFISFHKFCSQLLKYENNPLQPLIETIREKLQLQSLQEFRKLLRIGVVEFRREFGVGVLPHQMAIDLINSIPNISKNVRLYSTPLYCLIDCFNCEVQLYKDLIRQKMSSLSINTTKVAILTKEDVEKMVSLLPLEPNLSCSEAKEISVILKFGYVTALRIMSILSMPRDAMIDLNKMAALTSIDAKNCKTPFHGKLFAEAIQKDEEFLALIAETDRLLNEVYPNRELFFTLSDATIRARHLHNQYLKDNLTVFHGLRRGRLTELYKNGFSIAALSRFAGHKSIEVTRKYLSELAIEHELEESFLKLL